MTRRPVALLPFDPDLCLAKCSRVRRWKHADLGIIQEATIEEVMAWRAGQGIHEVFRATLPNPEGTDVRRTWARRVKSWED